MFLKESYRPQNLMTGFLAPRPRVRTLAVIDEIAFVYSAEQQGIYALL